VKKPCGKLYATPHGEAANTKALIVDFDVEFGAFIISQ